MRQEEEALKGQHVFEAAAMASETSRPRGCTRIARMEGRCCCSSGSSSPRRKRPEPMQRSCTGSDCAPPVEAMLIIIGNYLPPISFETPQSTAATAAAAFQASEAAEASPVRAAAPKDQPTSGSSVRGPELPQEAIVALEFRAREIFCPTS